MDQASVDRLRLEYKMRHAEMAKITTLKEKITGEVDMQLSRMMFWGECPLRATVH